MTLIEKTAGREPELIATLSWQGLQFSQSRFGFTLELFNLL
jgi:hypothetical protein